MGFVFYDTETTGTNTSFDQILQFAAIKTDHELSELERFEIRCRLLPDIVPSPGAVLITGVGPSRFTDSALPSHYEMVRTIKAKLDEWTPAVFLGHNSLSFDEHLLRQAFYKTLHAPYLTNTNNNCRTDSLRIVKCMDLYVPGIVNVPIGDNRQPTYKLDRLAHANGFNHSTAHDAMGDVEKTVHLCRLLAERADGYWSGFLRFAQKSAALDFVQDEEFFCLTETYSRKANSLMVCKIGENPKYVAEQLVFNLEVDPEELTRLDDDTLAARLTERPKPVRVLRSNASPALLAYEDIPPHLREAIPEENVLKERAARIRGDEHFARQLMDTFLSIREERAPSGFVEEQIYESFASRTDQALMERFHTMDWETRPRILESLSDTRARILGERLLHVEAPTVLSNAVRENLDIATARRLMGTDGSAPWLTLPRALSAIRDMLVGATGTDVVLLRELEDYLVDRSNEARTMIA